MNITYKEQKKFSKDDILDLYTDAGWTNYASNFEKLENAFNNSLLIIGAWSNDTLVGLIRVIGDGETIIYIQDLLVKSSFKRQGIGSMLVKKVLSKFPNVRQKVLITDDNEDTNLFYKSIGFKDSKNLNIKAFVNFEI
jgi:ribosomal protein S18 acetylase RimI-like enzyme